jgi:carboxyl-terminal processing protease
MAHARLAVVLALGVAHAAAARDSVSDAARLRREAFEQVWTKVRDHYHDPTFGGLDWSMVGDEFRGKIAGVKSDAEFHALLSQMLGRLGGSHTRIIPEEIYALATTTADDKIASDAPDPGSSENLPSAPHAEANAPHGSPSPGDIGAEVQVVEGRPTIVRVKPGGPAEAAALPPGDVVPAIGGRATGALARRFDETLQRDADRNAWLTAALESSFEGRTGTDVRVRVADATNAVREVVLRRAPLGRTIAHAQMPPIVPEVESRTLRGGVGYVRFNVFDPSLMDEVRGAIRRHRSAPGLILDLRGNGGGLALMAQGIAGLFVREKGNLGTSVMREGTARYPVYPTPDPLDLPLAVLVDERSASASEMLAAALQEQGRAFVVGTPSAGALLVSLLERLPTGARWQVAWGDFRTEKGRVIEGVGVVPDLTVPLSRSALLRGDDNVADAAARVLLARSTARGDPPR